MTIRLIFESVLIELGKVQAPTLKLYEFNYLANKAIMLCVNTIYNIYDINLLTTDDLRVLTSTSSLIPEKILGTEENYKILFPEDYLHLLNCICVFEAVNLKGCHKVGDRIEIPATKLLADSWPLIISDVYNKPSYRKPYYYIHTVTNDSAKSSKSLLKAFVLNLKSSETNDICCEIRYGRLNQIFLLVEVKIDYLRSPKPVYLTLELVDLTEDTSLIMEFPDYMNFEIINKLVNLAQLRTNNPALSTHILMNQSIARPTGQL